MVRLLFFLILTAFVFIKPLIWLGRRLEDGDGWSCYLGIALTLFFLFYHENSNKDRRFNFFHLSAILLIAYFLSPLMPNLIQGLLVLALFYSGFCLCLNKKINFHFLILICFCLPWISSFQFYFGYPLRLVCSHASLLAFKLMHLPVELKGIMFSYHDKIVYIDAPCSGINMLYLGMLFTVVLCLLYQLSLKKTIVLYCLSFLMILITNTIRYVLLFFKEADFVNLPDWMHSGLGLILFFIFNVCCFWLVTHHKILMTHYDRSMIICKNFLQVKGK